MSVALRRWVWATAVVLGVLASLAALAQQDQTNPERPRAGVRLPGQRERRVSPPAGNVPVATPRAGAGVAGTSAAAAPAPPGPGTRLEAFESAGGEKMIRMELWGTDIDSVLRLLSREAGVTINKSEQVTGNITVIAPDPVPLDVAFQIVNSVLRVRGFTMTRAATGIYHVLPIADAIQAGVPIEFGARPEDIPASDNFVTQVVRLSHLDAGDAQNLIKDVLSKGSLLTATSTNSLIITDTAANIQRALTLIADQEAQLSGGIQVIPLRYYPAEDMADLVANTILSRGTQGAGVPTRRVQPFEQRVVQAGGRAATQPARAAAAAPGAAVTAAGPEYCFPDTRSNSLVCLVTPLHLRQIQDLVEQLDYPVSLRDSYYVYPVQNLVASELAYKIAPAISAQVQTVSPESRKIAETRAAGAAGITREQTGLTGAARYPTTRGGTTFAIPGTGLVRGSSAEGAADAPMRPVRPSAVELEPLAAPANVAPGGGALSAGVPPDVAIPVEPQPALPPGEVVVMERGEPAITAVSSAGTRQALIIADDDTNTLLITAAPEQVELARQLLERLDVVLTQVHIQVIIAEVALTRDTSLGFQWESLGRTFGRFQGGVYTGGLGTQFSLGAAQDGDGDATRPSGFFGEITGPEFSAVLHALTTDSHARILSAPTIFTMSGQAGSINVSNMRPYPTGTLTTGYGTTSPVVSTSISYQSVGIVLNVTPRVTQGDMVQMDVEVWADEVGQPVTIAGSEYPSTLARQMSAVLNVKHGHTVVLGGLMRDTIVRSASRVPLLGDLPIVGSLFRSTSSKREKSELLVFLTPRVVRSSAEAAQLTEAEKRRLLEVPRSLRTPADGSLPAAPSKR